MWVVRGFARVAAIVSRSRKESIGWGRERRVNQW